MLTSRELRVLLDHIDTLPDDEREALLAYAEQQIDAAEIERARASFEDFVRYMWSDFIDGQHHRFMASVFQRVVQGEEVRMIVNLPPRHSKSTLLSTYFPAWFLGHFPKKKVIQVSHTADLAVDFGRKVRNLIASPAYQKIFPQTGIAKDSGAAGAWKTSQGGEYFAIGVGGALAGRGGDLIIVDDPHSEQDVKTGDPAVFDKVYEWWQTGARQRVQPHASLLVLHTRWSKRDLTGRLVQNMAANPSADQWELVQFPAILPSGRPLWPEFWSLDQLLKIKNSIEQRYWDAQYQQNPTSEEGAIIKREWWKWWEEESPPEVHYVIAALDTAAETKTYSDYSAITVWGVFYMDPAGKQVVPPEDDDAVTNIVLLNAIKKRVEFPDLKVMVRDFFSEWSPDSFIVEKKNSGTALYQELRAAGLPVSEYTPTRATGDKRARLNSVADIVKSGIVWVPRKRWAEELVEEVAEFPASEHDDLTDTLIMSLLRLRNGGFIRLPDDKLVDFDDVSEESAEISYDYY